MEAKKNPKQDLQRQSFKFFLIGLSISVSIMITAFEWRSKKSKQIPPTFDTPIEALLEVRPTVHEVTPPAPIPIKQNVSLSKSAVLITLIETDNHSDEIDDVPSLEDIYVNEPITNIPEETAPIIFTTPELMPAPIGGYKSFYEQLSNSIKYPRQAQRNHTEGKVFVEFIIDQKGNVSDLKIAKGIGDGCDEEAIRVLSQTRWQPGKQRGIPVKVRMTLPLTFKLN
jgi:protein TonB